MKVLVPLRTGAGQNDREHFRARARRVKAERHAMAWMLALHKPPAGPVTVHLCRISPGQGLDAHDNLRGSLKAPVDAVAEWLGRDDRDPSITWEYSQRRSRPGEWLVAIEVIQAASKDVGKPSSVDHGVGMCVLLGAEVAPNPVIGPVPTAAKNLDHTDPMVALRVRLRKDRVSGDVSKRKHSSIVAAVPRGFKEPSR